MKTRASQRPQCPRTRPDRGETPTSERMHTINQQPSTIRGEAQPVLPGNLGGLPTMGLELAAKPPAALVVEVVMAVAAVAVYSFWAKRTRPSARWYVGPAIAAGLLALTVPLTA